MRLLATLFALFALPPGLGPLHAETRTPNVVFILTDNQGAWTLGCYGNPDIRTPHIDRLAAGGVRFANAFCNNGVCSPTRATYLTGLMPSQHGVHSYLTAGRLQTGPEARNTLADIRSLPEILNDNGYKCGLVGKWHLGANESPQEGFDDYWITMPHGGTRTFHEARVIENGKTRTESEHLTSFWTKHAVRFLEENAKAPFFLYLAYNGPYGLGRYQIEPLRGPRAVDYAGKDLKSFPGGVIHPWQFNNREYFGHATAQRRYAAELSAIDDGVGTVMDSLKRLGLAEDTLVIFAADQGWSGGQHGLWGMGDHTRPLNVFEASLRIPLIFHHRGRIPGGQVPEIMTSNYDFVPSLLGYLGLKEKMPAKPASPGRDYSPVLRGEPVEAWQDEIFYEYETLRCVRTPDWKFVERFGDGHDELYDLRNDPDERRNLVAESPAIAVRDDLQKRLKTFFGKHAEPKFDLWRGGGSQTRNIVWRKEPRATKGRAPSPFDPDFHPPRFDLPEGFVAEVIAAPPLVRHPLMAALDDRGRLFIAEAAGVNLKAGDLAKQLPNFVRRLEDTNRDGIYDKSTVFADKMTFPQGALCLDGSVYVGSPPSIWKLTDTDDDGVADERKEIATGFGYTGNAASIHGPFLHPNGRIFWCHGRKDHEVHQKDGTLYSKGKGARIWSCNPDGTDLQAHAGGGLDNPVEIDFTPEGEIIGSVNLFYGRPRGDVLVHWLRGGRYPRFDQESVLKEFKATGPILREAHNFGHVAVSGMCIAKGPHFRNKAEGELDVLTAMFNTQEVTRTTLGWEGATLVSRKNETIVKIHDPNVHLTDVLEDVDGSLLLIDTGGWFRIGCPNSQIAKPEIAGAIYRIRPAGPRQEFPRRDPAPNKPAMEKPHDVARLISQLRGDDPRAVRRTAETLGTFRDPSAIDPLVQLLATAPERALEHSIIWALIELNNYERTRDALAVHPGAMPTGLWALDQMDSSDLEVDLIIPWLGESFAAVEIAKGHPEWAAPLSVWFNANFGVHPAAAEAFAAVAPAMIDREDIQAVMTQLLDSVGSPKDLAWRALESLPERMALPAAWRDPMMQALSPENLRELERALKAARQLESPALRERTKELAGNEALPSRLRLLALRAVAGNQKLSSAEFDLVVGLLGDGASPADRTTAVTMLNAASLTTGQLIQLAGKLPDSGTVEFPGLVGAFGRTGSAEVGSALASAIASAPATTSMAPSEIERVLNRFPPEAVAAARPRIATLREESKARQARLQTLASQVSAKGDAKRGRAVFESGAGACMTCHLIGDKGIDLGPNLRTIGRIRQPQDLLESILFPNASLARDFEAYLVRTKTGESQMGLVRNETARTLTLALPGGVTTRISRGDIASLSPAPVSLMPMGLEAAMSEQELLDLVAWLRSLK